MKRFLKYWLPPLIWAALFFPLLNHYLSQPFLYRWVMAAMKLFFPVKWYDIGGVVYIVIRKSLHFLEYAILAYLLYRAFRAEHKERWRWSWAWPAGLIASAYGLLDEGLQRLVPDRHGSLIDWAVDSVGVLCLLGLMYERREKAAGFPRALFLKRPFDIFLSSAGILLSSPLWVLFSLIIWLQDRGPVFYAQDRVGRGGQVFKALKFRSMIKNAEVGRGAVQAVEKDPRVTRFGRLLRATAMDELPQLLNIFQGDMSFVGPRALRPEEREVHGEDHVRRIEDIPGYNERITVRPGLTGLAQIFLPGDAPRWQKFRYDRFYIQNRSFWWDIELIILSFGVTFRGTWESRQKKI
jgi:lipopolysaccharide/colanic/teichoic acid biosynthesis glycosyltransferase/VanZ family protein